MSRRIRLVVMGAAIAIVAVIVFFLVINPIRADIAQLHSDIEQEDRLIAAAERELAQATQTQRDGRANQARLLELSKMIPSESEIPSLILQIQDLADRSGIEWIQVQPGQPSSADGIGYQTLTLSVNFSGTFYDITDFMYRAEQMVAGPGRLLSIKSVSLSIGTLSGSSSPEMNVSMSILAFVIPASAPVAPAATNGTESTETTENAQ